MADSRTVQVTYVGRTECKRTSLESKCNQEHRSGVMGTVTILWYLSLRYLDTIVVIVRWVGKGISLTSRNTVSYEKKLLAFVN